MIGLAQVYRTIADALRISVLRRLYLAHGERAIMPVQPRLLNRIDGHDRSAREGTRGFAHWQ